VFSDRVIARVILDRIGPQHVEPVACEVRALDDGADVEPVCSAHDRSISRGPNRFQRPEKRNDNQTRLEPPDNRHRAQCRWGVESSVSATKQSEIDDALDKLDGSGSDSEWAAVEFLRQAAPDHLPSLLLKKYRVARKAGERASCVYHATRYARTNADAVQLGREALKDGAHPVRYRACLLLAYSQDRAVLEELRAALPRTPESSRKDIAAAIDAIESRDHHYFVDRNHSGKVKLNIR